MRETRGKRRTIRVGIVEIIPSSGATLCTIVVSGDVIKLR